MVISQTPLRISLIGGGTDFLEYYSQHNGCVISTTIDKYIYVVVKERFDNLIVLHYTENEIVENIESIKHELIKECLKKVDLKTGVEIITLADIPSKGSGLGSSSALIVGLLNALYTFHGMQVSHDRLAKETCEIEIDILKKPIGKQDQYIVATGGFKKITFLKNGDVNVEPINISREHKKKVGSNLLLHYTNHTRNANTILEKQKENIVTIKNDLDKLTALTSKLEKELHKLNFDYIGTVLKENWELKKTFASNVTNKGIDEMIKLAMANGAIGCKIAGAGGGGFLLSYVPLNLQDKFRDAMSGYRELSFTLEPYGSRILLNVRNYSNNF